MTETLIRVERGGYSESFHCGAVVIADSSGAVKYEAGDGSRTIYARSSIKPVQALPLVLSGAADRFGLNEQQLAVCCGSHNGEPMHTQTVQELLAKGGLEPGGLRCGVHPPYGEEAAAELIRSGTPPQTLHNNCSGKHAGMLLASLHTGLPENEYDQPSHPVQQEVRQLLGVLGGLDPERIRYGTDGCGLPTYRLPLERLALIFARLGEPSRLPAPLAAAIPRLTGAMARHPEMVGGTGEFDTRLIQVTSGRIIGKEGAEGIYALAIPSLGLGAALKVDDGNRRALFPAAMAVLEQLKALRPEESAALADFREPLVRSRRGEVAGALVPVLRLREASRQLQEHRLQTLRLAASGTALNVAETHVE